MTTIFHQDSELILLNPYDYTGDRDLYVKQIHPFWSQSIVGDAYKVLIDRSSGRVVEAVNEYYNQRYSSIETSLIGDVLILGLGLAVLDQFLITGSSWKWVEKNNWLFTNITPTNGTAYEGNAEDMEFLATLGTFDTILIDFPQTQINDYSPLLNIGGNVIEFKL